MMTTYLDLLPDDVLEQIKSMIAVNPPPHLKLYDVLYFQMVNNMNSKQLISYCNDNHIKKSRWGSVNNQYVKRLNIIERYLGRKTTEDEELVIVFTRGEEMNTYKNWII